MPIPYTKLVIEHFKNPHNVGEIQDADVKVTEGSPACGDMITLYLKIDPKTRKIVDVKFKSYGCASNIATASIITDLVKGKTVEEAKNITWKDAAEALGGLPPVKVHCSVLAADALHSAVELYLEKNGLTKEHEPTTVDKVYERLSHVMNPETGIDIVKSKIVKSVVVNSHVVEIVLNIPETFQFGENIKEEILERLQYLWDVKEVKILFKE
ncbi:MULTISPECIES: iron-sulfur cluster assembly scaffold protein [Caldisericum]|jgi:NifU-like protein involved in Fe-S cluster formation|uniref:Iron-sulfur cluster assembly scaffold protein n=2 Tax=Caldisericum exile TaxID=693075 RepID=A0A2J6WDV5_9BACT|nr:MAG: iron-sulfur cluster assembly scaffold protein [Caldisericum exile]